ncbi:DNA repair protein RecO [Clostridium sp. CX1]|uniref:DNA repair protein RecO n=1 Tax=Clostridium tanneri TaxID=3037988 RepID=A0ABU4JPC0_9CLOT|nr:MULTISPECIES: DNA repair protein RecO [unclassified Clostridium]MCT8976241.1 DNA repair protein RecO [Clostridium sp. CX1]MDW8799806.1 DNA repair protein RecO [Clostridium sp. A1-XYC3]
MFTGGVFLSTFKTRAVVIKTQDIKESDKLLWLFSEKLGKISTIARGAKKNRSNLFSATLQFCYADYVVYRGKSLYTINESSVIHSFQDLMSDLDLLTYASYFCELVDISMQDEESNRELFRYLVTAFYLMKDNVVDIETLARAFEIKVLQSTGYGFNLDYCSSCRKKMNSSNYISLQYIGGICDQCERVNGIYINYATYNTLKYLSKISLENVYRVNLSEETKKELYKVLSLFIEQSYFRKPRSLDTLSYLTKFSEDKR